MKKVVIGKNDAGQRLDKFLFKFFASIPASMVYKGIRKKRIKVNGKRSEENFGYGNTKPIKKRERVLVVLPQKEGSRRNADLHFMP